ncbi:cupin domain-containing protein [Bdellovibrio sp. HCB337]|uniref:cupin domain-containing protein n=1 Tax=Bdellovibrio sp. HCB337 TaxID=3394358 RepID=UPI0039A45B52
MELSTETHRHEEKVEVKSFDRPREIRNFPNGHLELIEVYGRVIGRVTLEPGWKWSESVQPIAKTKSCEAAHFQYHVAGVLMVKMDNGETYQCRPGDISVLPPGHDAWVVGDEPVVIVDFQGMVDYAKSP